MIKLITIVLLLVPAMVSAQERVLINRTDGQTGVLIQQEMIESGDRYTLLMQSAQQTGKTFKLVMMDTVINFIAGEAPALHGDITNLTNKPVQITFHRTHLHLPSPDWTASVCFGLNCFAAFVDSTPPSNAYSLDPVMKGLFKMNFYSMDSLHSDSIVDYIRFNALNGDPGDTVSFILKAIINNAPEAIGDQQAKTTISHPKIKAVYPSPLVLGNEIKVKISSPRESSLSYSIYDGIGRVVALGVTRQRISLGDNTIGINSLDGLTGGSYMLKLNFGDGSSDAYFFQVMR